MMIDFNLPSQALKVVTLTYFRERASESLQEITQIYGTTQYKKRATALNKALNRTYEALEKNLRQEANQQRWDNATLLPKILTIAYSKNVVMIESRNTVWPYDYMAFSRRIGELWEPFCRFCFEYPINDIRLFIPPLFSKVRSDLQDELERYISALTITDQQKNKLKAYYGKVWKLLASGDIKLELDLHFVSDEGVLTNVDFKSGFGSNEKGNTNRLLMVATIYETVDENHQCVLLVRSHEDSNNNYFQTLKNSGVWRAFCGDETYEQIKKFTGHDLRGWIDSHVNWKEDLSDDTYDHFVNYDLTQYLQW